MEKPIIVFISSAQEEFEDFRKSLKQTIDTEPWSNQLSLRAVLIENQRRDVIPNAIRTALDEASIYVGIFGRQLRDWPRAEFEYARSCTIPQLVYKYEPQPRRKGTQPKKGPKTKVDKFLEKYAYDPGIRVFGPYDDLNELADKIIPADLAITAVQMVQENAAIRRRLYQGIPKFTGT